jgi:hypothetical protein
VMSVTVKHGEESERVINRQRQENNWFPEEQEEQGERTAGEHGKGRE